MSHHQHSARTMAVDQALDGGAHTALERVSALAPRNDVPGRVLGPLAPLLRAAGHDLLALETLPFSERDLSKFGSEFGRPPDHLGDRFRGLARTRKVAAVKPVDLGVPEAS